MKFVAGPIGSQFSGSVGATTASHNRFGPYLRQRVTPVNPNTVRQQLVRAIMGTLVVRWTSVLTQLQRDGWDQYGDQVPVLDGAGNPINLTGQQHYIRSNTARLQLGPTAVDDAPSVFTLGAPVTNFVTTTNQNTNEIGIDVPGTNLSSDANVDGGASDDGIVSLYIGPPINASRQFYKGPYQLAAFAVVTAGLFVTSFSGTLASLINGNGVPTEDETRPIKVSMLYNDGRLPNPYRAIATVVQDGP